MACCAIVSLAPALISCKTTTPSMIERMQPSIPRYREEVDLQPPLAQDPGARVAPDLAPLLMRAVIESQERFAAGMDFDAYVPHEPFSWLVTLRVEEVLEGRFDADTIRIVIRSPLEQFAFPFAEEREFRLTLIPNSRHDEYNLIEIDPSGAEVSRRARQQRKRDDSERSEGEGQRE